MLHSILSIITLTASKPAEEIVYFGTRTSPPPVGEGNQRFIIKSDDHGQHFIDIANHQYYAEKYENPMSRSPTEYVEIGGNRFNVYLGCVTKIGIGTCSYDHQYVDVPVTVVGSLNDITSHS